MLLDYDNLRTRSNRTLQITGNEDGKTPLELLRDFYEMQNNQPMSAEQEAFAADLMEKIWEGQK